jgi:hypothetical protein
MRIPCERTFLAWLSWKITLRTSSTVFLAFALALAFSAHCPEPRVSDGLVGALLSSLVPPHSLDWTVIHSRGYERAPSLPSCPSGGGLVELSEKTEDRPIDKE